MEDSRRFTALAFDERRRLYGELMVRFLHDCPGPTVLLADLPGNVGDHLIWAGTEKLLHDHGIPFGALSVQAARYGVDKGGTLVVPGSGAWVDLWHEWLPDLVHEASSQFERVVVLPSQYDPAIPIVRQALSHPNVFPFARDATSYRAIKELGRAALAFDPALYAWDFSLSTPPADGSSGPLLVALRTDAGSQLQGHGLRIDPSGNVDISAEAQDLEGFLHAIRRAGRAVTDRLHVVVACIMTGTPVDYVDPIGQKISDYLAFTFRGEADGIAVRRDPAWLAEAGYVLSMGGVH